VKISGSIRKAYDAQVDLQKSLEDRVVQTLTPRIKQTWHLEGRVKRPESFALKVETGRVDPYDLEDFYACTIVVPTMDVIDEAEFLINELFEVVSRKPETNKTAMAGALDFRFDHLRIYARLRVPLGLDGGPIFALRFEVQIKTFLQHAWSIATHDLTYKTNDLSWGKERVAAQVKATLEAAEVSIVEAERLATSGNRLLAREDTLTVDLAMIAKTLLLNFTSAQLPEDVKRLALTIRTTLEACGLEVGSLEALLRRGKKVHGGQHPTDQSPFGVVLLYLVEQQPTKLRRALTRKSGPMIFLPSEVELPSSFSGQPMARARVLV